jgi:hypothetical protein
VWLRELTENTIPSQTEDSLLGEDVDTLDAEFEDMLKDEWGIIMPYISFGPCGVYQHHGLASTRNTVFEAPGYFSVAGGAPFMNLVFRRVRDDRRQVRGDLIRAHAIVRKL